MGQTLSEPVTTKDSFKCENSQVKVGSSCMQGWRINMEDAHTHLLSLPGDKEASFFGVFDGHGGVKVAHYAGNNLHKRIVSQSAYSKGNISEAIRQGFLFLDEEMMKDDTLKDDLAGTTAVVVLLKEGKLFCGNVGDSRAVASVAGEVEQLSFDHKPSNEVESRRIIAAGGWVEFNRVNGNLALSRALGDFVFKKNEKKRPEEQIVTAYPDVIEKPITADHEFVLLACDGIWDVLTNQEVVDFVRSRIAQRMEPDVICEELMMRCLAPDCQMGGLGCDNMTVVLICFLHGGSYADLARKCARPSRSGADSKQKQHAVIEFLMKEECSLSDIHRRLQSVYGDDIIDKSNVHRWMKTFKEGETSIEGKPCSGRQSTDSCGQTSPNPPA